jgi:hypothetical protein
MSNTYLDRLNPNLLVCLHYASRTMWLVLAGLFGLIGYQLYALGISDHGDATGSFLGLKFSLHDAGPGLVVMIFALVCSVIGAIRTKLELGPDIVKALAPPPEHRDQTAEERPITGRECKLSHDMLELLMKTKGAFAMLNSNGEVDIESVGWATISPEIRRPAVMQLAKQIKLGKHGPWSGKYGDCTMSGRAISADQKTWCIVELNPTASDAIRQIAQEETRPIIFGV